MGGVSATLGNGYKIQGQNYVARLQGRVLYGPTTGILCWVYVLGKSSDMLNWPNGQQGNLLFRRSVIVPWEGRFFNF